MLPARRNQNYCLVANWEFAVRERDFAHLPVAYLNIHQMSKNYPTNNVEIRMKLLNLRTHSQPLKNAWSSMREYLQWSNY